MKKCLPAAVIAGLAVFFMFSCTSVDPSKRYPNMVADMDPLSVGTAQAVFDRMFSSNVDGKELDVVFHPRQNTVALQFRHELITYRQFWDQAARVQFAAALELYKADYEALNLIDRHNRTRAVYGRVKGRLEWQSFRFAKTNVSNPTIEFGYRFRNNSPYFAVCMRSAKAEDSSGNSPDLQSQQITIYFTRAQADELVRMFSQSYLLSVIEEKQDAEFQPSRAEGYNEAEY